MTVTRYPSQAAEKYIVRFPEGMREKIIQAATAGNRSINAEIVTRLESTFQNERNISIQAMLESQLVTAHIGSEIAEMALQEMELRAKLVQAGTMLMETARWLRTQAQGQGTDLADELEHSGAKLIEERPVDADEFQARLNKRLVAHLAQVRVLDQLNTHLKQEMQVRESSSKNISSCSD